MPTENARLPFEIDATIDPTLVTGRAGVPLVIELFRQLGVAAAVDAHVPIKQRQRGLPPTHLVESLIALWTSGGDRCQDLTTLREDHALATLLGYPLPAATTVRDFLDAFHVEGGPLWQAGPAGGDPPGVRAPGGRGPRESHAGCRGPAGRARPHGDPRCGRDARGEPQGRGHRGLRRDARLPARRRALGRAGPDPA